MKPILSQDDCAPDALPYFKEKFAERMLITLEEFKSKATKEDLDDGYCTEWTWNDGTNTYKLSIEAGDPWYKLYLLPNCKPKEITLCSETKLEVAHFGYYDGIAYAKQYGLVFTTEFSEVRKGTHYLVSCGDVMVKVESNDFTDILRRTI